MTDSIKAFIKNNRLAFAAFLLPVLVMVLAFAVTGVYPFGSRQIAVIDMYHQYVPFLGELQYKLQEGGSLFYSWNSGGGCNFWCLLSYYGASPLNLLLILFPKSLLMEGVTVILLIKVGLTGSFMFTYLKNATGPAENVHDRKRGWHTVVFAAMYALCAYVIGYYWCIMWLDAVMLLPLVMLGLVRLIDRGGMALYTISLALTVFSNYYIAIMVCIFILVYYPVLYFIRTRGFNLRRCAKVTAKAVFCSLLAIAMAAVMLLPTYFSMKNAYYFSSDMPEEWSLYNNILDILNQLLPNAQLTYIDGLPNLCCGMLVTIMLIFYFITREIPLKEKALNGAFLLFMFFSLNLNKLDFIWHGMHFPNQLPYRYTFVICFLLVAMGYRTLNRIDSISTGNIIAVIAGGAGYYVLAQKMFHTGIDNMTVFVYYGLALLAGYGTVLLLYRQQRITRKTFVFLVAAVVTAELCITTCTEISVVGNSSRETYNENKSSITELAAFANERGGATSEGGDGRFSRTEIDDPIIHNCPAMYHYRGMGQFSSTINSAATTLMEKIGLESNPGGNRFNYNETCPVLNCITNVNYLIARDRSLEDSDFALVKKSGNSRLYESKYPLSIGYMLPGTIRTWQPESDNPFTNLEKYLSSATEGEITSVFSSIGRGELKGNGLKSHYDSHGIIETELEKGSTEGTLYIRYTAPREDKYYVFVEADSAEEITIDREDNKDDLVVQPDCGSIMNIGTLREGETFRVKIEFETGRAGRTTCHVCTMDKQVWDRAYEMISAETLKVEECGDSFIKGTVRAEEGQVLVTSIPYEEGWSLKVDGRPREITELVGGSWISVGLDEGTHEIELSFRPPGVIAGLLISLIASIILMLICQRRRIRRLVSRRLQGAQQYRKCCLEESDCNRESE
ncbi:MAG: YfhO family protein [Lentihominibacter sp.]